MRKLMVVLILTLFAIPVFSSTEIEKAIGMTKDDSIIFGNIHIRGAANGNIVVAVDRVSASDAPDGIPDLIFRYAPKKIASRYKGVVSYLEGARLFYSDRRLTVLSRDGQVMASLSLEKIKKSDPAYALYGSRSSDTPDTIRISNGVGLMRQTSAPDQPLELNVEHQFILSRLESVSPQDIGGILDQACDGGGPSSESCSYSCGSTTCSVSCRTGSYACCYCSSSVARCNCR